MLLENDGNSKGAVFRFYKLSCYIKKFSTFFTVYITDNDFKVVDKFMDSQRITLCFRSMDN